MSDNAPKKAEAEKPAKPVAKAAPKGTITPKMAVEMGLDPFPYGGGK